MPNAQSPVDYNRAVTVKKLLLIIEYSTINYALHFLPCLREPEITSSPIEKEGKANK